jgi:hypothetical protein
MANQKLFLNFQPHKLKGSKYEAYLKILANLKEEKGRQKETSMA